MGNIIEINELSKQYKRAKQLSLDAITLSIQSGEKLGIFGPNGAGKTTLIAIICNILQASSGTVRYFLENKSVKPKEILPRVGFVPQNFAFYPELTPVQNLRFFGSQYGMNAKQVDAKMDTLLQKVNLNDVRHQKIETFSGGMQRRINLAIGLINEPEILFLDEPIVGVDIQSKMAIQALLEELHQNGTTIVHTSHHLKEAEGFCDRVAILNEGKLIACDLLSNLLEKHKTFDLESLIVQLTSKNWKS